MIKVDLHNYELFAIDYTEGRLVGDDLSAFKKFLENHPEIKNEIDSLNSEIIDFENNVEFNHKTDLKKEALLNEEINLDNYKTYFVAYYENDLGNKTREKVLEFAKQDTDKSKEFEAFSKIKLAPDQSIYFPIKRLLKKTTPIITLYKGLRVAASVAIILGFAWYFSQLNKVDQQYTERTANKELKKIPKSEDEQLTESTSNNFAEQLNEDTKTLTKINKQIEKKPVQNEFHPEEEISTEREALISMASTNIQSAKIEQQFNADLKTRTKVEKVELAAEDENIFKIKLPKLFRKSNKKDKDSEEESTTLARTKINIKKKDKDPDQKTYVDLGPFKVYKKKGVTANASNLNESKEGL